MKTCCKCGVDSKDDAAWCPTCLSRTFATGATHRNLGHVEIDGNCLALQAMNPDTSSIFVKHEGEIKEVTRSLVSTSMNPGVYLFKERTAVDHELHKVFDGKNWHFGAAGISSALHSAELGLKGGEVDVKGPVKQPLGIEVLGEKEASRLSKIVAMSKNLAIKKLK